MAFEERAGELSIKAANFGWDLAGLKERQRVLAIHMNPLDLSFDEVHHTINQAVNRSQRRAP